MCFMQMREQKKKKTELTVNDNPGSVSHQDPIERIEEDASSTYFSSTRREQSHRKRFSLSCPDLTRFKIIASNDRVVAHRIPWITKDRVKFETEFRKNSNRIKWDFNNRTRLIQFSIRSLLSNRFWAQATSERLFGWLRSTSLMFGYRFEDSFVKTRL